MNIILTEVAPRDGLQNEQSPISTAEKIELIRRVIAAGIRRVEVTSFVSPRAVPQLSDAEDVLRGLGTPEGVILEALVPNLRGATRAAETAVHEWVCFVSATESHSQANSNCSVSEALDRLQPVVSLAMECGRTPVAAIAVAFACPFEGITPIERTLEITRKLSAMGIRTIKLGDTIGTAHPRHVGNLVARLQSELPELELVMHFHDTRGFSLANVMTSLSFGLTRFESSVGGLGGCPFAPGATGNVATEDLVHFLHAEGHDTGCNLGSLFETGKWMEGLVGRPLPARMLHALPIGVTVPLNKTRRAVG